jgi:hypothetical protein
MKMNNYAMKVAYSTSREKKKEDKYINNLNGVLSSIYKPLSDNDFSCNTKNQKVIEEIIFSEYELLFKNLKKGYTIDGLNSSGLSTKLKRYIIDNEIVLSKRIERYKEYYYSNSVPKNMKDDNTISIILLL